MFVARLWVVESGCVVPDGAAVESDVSGQWRGEGEDARVAAGGARAVAPHAARRAARGRHAAPQAAKTGARPQAGLALR